MKKMLLLGVFSALLLAAVAVYATPSLPGPSGNAAFPTAMITPAGVIILAADFDNNEEIPGAPGSPDHATKPDYPIRLLYGAGKNLEVGLAYNRTKIDGSIASFKSANAKYQLPSKKWGMTWAIGARFVESEATLSTFAPPPFPPSIAGDEQTWVAYLAATKACKVSENLTINSTIGLNYNNQNTDFNVPGKPGHRESGRIYLSLDSNVTDKLNLSTEIQYKHPEEDNEAVYAITARYALSDMLGAEVGYTNLDQAGILGLAKGKLFAGINIAFDGR